MKLRLITALGVATILLASCAIQQPIAHTAPQNNKTYNVSYLFEYEGCKVYRFEDMGNYVYFTTCPGNVTSIKMDSTTSRVNTIVRTNP